MDTAWRFHPLAGGGLTEPLPSWLLDTLPCAKEGFSFINPDTQFLSFCLTSLAEASISLLVLVPIIVSAWNLSGQAKGSGNVRGQLATLFALIAPLLRLTDFFLLERVPSYAEYVTIVTGFAAAVLVSFEDGRVRVSSTETVLYYGATMITTAFFLVDAIIRDLSTLWVRAFLFGVTFGAFATEVTNTRNKTSVGYDTANIFDKLSLRYINPLLWKGSKEEVTRDDFPVPPMGLTALNTYTKLDTALESYSTDNKYRLLFALFKIVRGEVLVIIFLDVISDVLAYIQPLILAKFLLSLRYFISNDAPIFPAIYFGVLYAFFPIVSVALQNLATLTSSLIYVTSRTALTGLIYRKALSLSPKAREEYDSAKIMSLLNVDTDQIDGIANEIPTLISAPLAIVLATLQLYNFIGSTMISAVPLYIVFIIYSSVVSKYLFGFYPEQMKIRDARTKTTSDAFRNIKSLKLYAWEKPFYDKIAKIRVDQELALQQKIIFMNSTLSSAWTSMGDFVAATIFVTFLWFQMGTLTPEIVFPCLGLLSYVTFPFMRLPMSITVLGRALTSQTRINDYLLQDDQDSKNFYKLPASNGFTEESVAVKNAVVSWNGETEDAKIALNDISFSASNGDLVCVIGRVGTGKTAFLKAIANELSIISGSVTVKGTVCYCPQEVWLQNKSLKDNILFGKKFDEEFYKTTIEACALVKDIENLPNGDETDVGERGISLSGGQKARVALARAVYSRADVYILDDVLSAVDEHVSAQLIESLLSKDGLLATKTIILATNNIKVLSHASNIIALQNKAIVEQVSFAEVLSKKEASTTYKLVSEFGTGGDLDNIVVTERKTHISKTAGTVASSRRASIDFSRPTLFKGQEEEESDKGAVSLNIFRRYFAHEKGWYLGIFCCILLTSVVLTNGISIWLGILSDQGLSNLVDGRFYVTVYISMAVASMIFVFCTIFSFAGIISLHIAKKIHNSMLHSVMRAPMQFFDQTPLGRLINRFTGDIERLDNQLPYMLYYFVRSILNVVMCIITVLIGAPFVIIVVIPLIFVANAYRKVYVPASRRISRMASAANSPILSHIEESVKGSSVVRTFDRMSQFIDIYEFRTDYWIELNFLRQSIRSWLLWRVQTMTTMLDLSSIIVMIILVYYGWLDVGFVGVVIYNSARVGVMVRQTIFMWADLEVSGVALDRILEYIDMEQEAPAHIPETEPAASWPEEGAIVFNDFSTRYRKDLEDVLHQISFSIGKQEKIGIVGRTGSGKSTLTLAIFRLIEASHGNVSIDSVDTSKLGLTDLRSKLSIIPQDAQIFGGSLRENMDPFSTADDTKLWQVLEMCHLKEHFQNLGTGLDTMLSEGGGNLSRGQAQLICLGRALLNEAKILVLDEATASVDVETDKIVQTTIRSAFKDRTIVTIAHRLHTISDSDRILTLDKGNILEFDSPENLLKARGAFWKLSNAGKDDELHEDD